MGSLIDSYLKQLLVFVNKECLYDLRNIISGKNEIAKFVSKMLVNTYDYSEKLELNMFVAGYNFHKEWNWIISDFYTKNEKQIDIAEKHYLYNTFLDRSCYINELCGHQIILQNTIEKKCVDWANSFYSDNDNYDCTTIILTNTVFVYSLGYLPRESDLKHLFVCKEQSNKDIDCFENKLLEYVKNKNDFKYLEECRINFGCGNYNKLNNEKTNGKIKIKYYGPVGTSGYAKACNNIIFSIYNEIDNDNSPRFDIYFEPIQFHNYLETDTLLSNLYNKKQPSNYDYIIIHSMPELFPIISYTERNKNKNVIIYGITVWEIDTLPNKWDLYCKYVDKISVPSTFSSLAFNKSELPPVDIVFHPLILDKSDNTDHCMLYCVKSKYKYIFYNISEWTNRKGIAELIEIFLKTFGENKDILLYIKTFGDISETDGIKYINDTSKKFNINYIGNVILDYTRVSDSYINCIHNCCDCFISLTKSEGQGLGICYSVLYGNRCIVTGYSGFKDYIDDYIEDSMEDYLVDYINYTLEPATFCSIWSKKHFNCKDLPHCQYFDKFLPSTHMWAKADLKHTKQLMLNVINKSRIKKNINNKFKTFDVYNSLITTKRNICTIKLDTQKQLLDYLPQSMYFNWPLNTKKILIINTGGNGNIGDYTYSFIVNKFFSDKPEFKLIFLSDNDIHKEFVNDFDFLIIGGGGLLNKERLHSKNLMHFYSNHCIKNNIPYYIISVGFQDTEVNLNGDFDKFKGFSKLLDNSDFISVRSTSDYNIACQITKKQTKEFLYVYCDLAYSLNKFIPAIESYRDILLVVLDENWISLSNKFIIEDINRRMVINPKLKLVFTEFTGVDPGKVPILNKTEILKLFPNSTFESGIITKDLYPLNHLKDRTNTLSDIIDLLCKTDTIISGRYHSNILGKVYNVPNMENYNYSNYKLQAEKISNLDTKKSLEPLNIIFNYMCYDIKFKSKNWTEDDRNSGISKVNEKTGIAINFIQNWNNRTIEEKLKL